MEVDSFYFKNFSSTKKEEQEVQVHVLDFENS